MSMPWAEVVDNLSSATLSSLAGNSMHLVAVGLVLAYLLAFTDSEGTQESGSQDTVT